MIRGPLGLVALFAGALLVTYFGFSTVSPDLRQASETRSKSLEVTGFENLEMEAVAALTTGQKAELDQHKKVWGAVSTDEEKAATLKTLSGFWFDQGQFPLAGSYARKVAELEKTEQAWQIAGTTFLYGLDSDLDIKKKQFCQQGAVYCLEQAISLNTAEPSHQLYLAMAYVKLPGAEPMKGIKMMLDMEAKYKDYLPLQLQLAELGIQTGQFEKALARLQNVLNKEPELPRANCLMVEVLKQLGRTENLNSYQLLCK